MPKEKLVRITSSELRNLKEDSEFLNCLKVCGVDNWPGYGDAQQLMNEEENEE